MRKLFSNLIDKISKNQTYALVFGLILFIAIVIGIPYLDSINKNQTLELNHPLTERIGDNHKISTPTDETDYTVPSENDSTITAKTDTDETVISDNSSSTVSNQTNISNQPSNDNDTSYAIIDISSNIISPVQDTEPIVINETAPWDEGYYQYQDDTIEVKFGDKDEQNPKVTYKAPIWQDINGELFNSVSNWLDRITNRNIKSIEFSLVDAYDSRTQSEPKIDLPISDFESSFWNQIKNFFVRIFEDNPNNILLFQEDGHDIILNKSVLKNINVKYQILNNRGIKEEIVIVNRDDLKNSFVFSLKLDKGMKYNRNQEMVVDAPANVYYFYDEQNRYIAHFVSLYAEDQAGAKTENVTMKISQLSDTDHKITITVDPEWLYSSERKFPIIIDPSIVHDTQTEFDTAKSLNRVTTNANPSIELSGPPYKNYGVYTSDVIDFGIADPNLYNMIWTENGVQTGSGETDLTTNGLVAKWNFNETSGTSVSDSSGNGHTGTLTNMTTTGQDASVNSGWTANNKKWGTGSVMFDGSNDYIDVPSFTFNENGIFAVSFWMNPVKTGTNLHYLLDFRNADANGQSAVISYDHNNTGAIDYTIFGESNWHNGTIPLNERSWNHVVVIHNSNSNNLKTYINGQLDQNVSVNDFTITGSPLRIGARRLTGAAPYKGSIDAIKIFNRDLSENEIISLYNSTNIEFQTRTGSDDNPYNGGWEEWKPAGSGTETQLDSFDNQFLYPTSETGLTNYWPMDELSGSNVDEPVNSADGTATGTKIIDGKYAKARYFNGTSDYLSVTNSSVLNPGNNFTIESWIYQPTISDNGAIISTLDITNGVVTKGYAFKTNTSSLYGWRANSLMLQLGTPTWNWGYWTSPTNSLTAGRWHHVAVTVANANTASKTVYFYIDGKQYPGAFWTNNSQQVVNFNTNTTSSRIGGIYTATMPSYNTTYFNGNIDELKIYSAILSADQISQKYLEGKELFNLQPCIYQTNDSDIKVEGSYSSRNSFGHAITSQNLVALWHLDETGGSGAYLKDSSGNNNHATPSSSNNNIENGITGKGRKTVNGGNITIPDSTSLRPAGAFSFNFWIKTNGLNSTAQSYFINKETWSSSGWAIMDNGSYTSDVMFRVLPSGTGTCGTGVACMSRTLVNDNNWHMISGVYNGSNIFLYLDGVQKDSRSAGSFTTSNNNVLINQTSGSANGVLMDEISIHGTALSVDEINELYRLGRDHYVNNNIDSIDLSDSSKIAFYTASDQPGENYDLIVGESTFANYQTDANTIGLWHLNDKTNNIFDSSGYYNNGTTSGTTAVNAYLDYGRSFNGTSDWINIDSEAADMPTTTSNLSVSAWVKWDDAPTTNEVVISYGGNNSATGWLLQYETTGKIQFSVRNANSVSSGITPVGGHWYHLTGTYDHSNVKLYIDGQLVGSSPATSNIITATTLRFGNEYNRSYYFDGVLDEIRIDKIARTPEEIRQAYEIGKRTHSITFDFAAGLDSANTISGSGDYSFTVDATTKGLGTKGEGLYVGDKIIIKENYDGTEYIAQGIVEAVNQTTGATVVSAWDVGSTFPSGGFTQYADAFKWQREYFDLTGILDDHLETTQLITIRKTTGTSGSTIWLDDLNSIDSYLTDPLGSEINSSDNQYLQYRAIFTTQDENITPSISDVTINFDNAPEPSFDSADTSQSSINLNNQNAFNVQCQNAMVYASGQTVTCQGSWDNSNWNTVVSTTSPVSGTIQGTPDITTWTGYPADGNVTIYVRMLVESTPYGPETFSVTKDTVRPTINSINSVAGDTSDPYLDPTDDGSTIVSLNTTDASTCRWDESDTDYASMSNTCSSPTNCDLDMTGEGGHIVYFQCIDSSSNSTANSYELTYSLTYLEDWDGIPYASDNCPETYNPNQSDMDGDTSGDACDPETLISANTTWPAGEYNFKYLHVTNNATLTLNSNTGSPFPGVSITGENITVDNGSKISADQKGYGSAQGPGAGANGNTVLQPVGGTGADHGSRGGNGINHTNNDNSYGNAYEPTTLGSGGGSEDSFHNTYGGPGGGAIKINISGILTNNGIISTNAGNAIFSGYGIPQGSGGGSGGSIWIITNTINGNGSIQSNGGAATTGANCSNCYGGGGSGGRISINFSTSNYAGAIKAMGGTGHQQGEDGTISYNGNMSNSCDTGNPFSHCYIDQIHHLPNNLSYKYNNLTIESGGQMEFKDDYTGTLEPGNLSIETDGMIKIDNSAEIDITGVNTIDIDGEIYLESGTSGNHSVLSLSGDDITISGNSVEGERWSEINIHANDALLVDGLVKATWIDITGDNFNITSSGQIITDTLGHPSTSGPGAGSYGNSTLGPVGATGAGHGAVGGDGYDHTPGGSSYGDQNAPVDLGSGGGSQNSSYPDFGGPGGGALKINLNGTLNNNGLISSNASDAIYSGYGFPQGSGGGSGGSIWIISDALNGSGQIEADGGDGNDGINAPVAYGGCGSGGRIKIEYVTNSFTGDVTADGGTIGHAVPCSAGSIVYTQNSSSLPRVNSITSVAGDTSLPYEDTTDNSQTLVEFTTLNSPTNVKWDTIDTNYDSMTNSCGSITQCLLDLSGNGVKTVYFRATDGSGNNSASSYVLQYTINDTSVSEPFVSAIISVAGDDTPPYVDVSDDEHTMVNFSTINNSTNVKWDNTDTDYDSMSNSCDSITECDLNLAGDGIHVVYFRATDGSGNKSSSSTQLQYTIRQTEYSNQLSSSFPSENDLTLTVSFKPSFSEPITDGSIKLIMDDEFDFSGLTINDVSASGGDVTWTNDEQIYAGGIQIARSNIPFVSIAKAQGENSITFNFTGDISSEDGEITFIIGGLNQPGNPPTEGPYSYILEWYEENNAGGSPLYIQDGKVHINTGTTVSASVPTAFSFIIDPVGTGTVNGANITTSTTTGNTANFGTFTSADDRIAAHDLIVSTNSTSGYIITTQYSGLFSSATDNMNNFTGSNTAPTTWTTPPGSGVESYFAYTTNDSSLLNSSTDRFTSSGGNKWASFATTPSEVSYSNTAVIDETTRVGYRLEITNLQPAGIYSTNVMYIATPTF